MHKLLQINKWLEFLLQVDVVVSLLPASFHAAIARVCIEVSLNHRWCYMEIEELLQLIELHFSMIAQEALGHSKLCWWFHVKVGASCTRSRCNYTLRNGPWSRHRYFLNIMASIYNGNDVLPHCTQVNCWNNMATIFWCMQFNIWMTIRHAKKIHWVLCDEENVLLSWSNFPCWNNL